MISQIVSPWVGAGTDAEPFAPAVDELTHDWTDVTDQAPATVGLAPGLVVVEVRCDAVTLAAIEADGRFYTLWSEENGE